MTDDYVLFDLPNKQGHARYAWAIEASPFGAPERVTPGYVGQEIASRIKQKAESRKRK